MVGADPISRPKMASTENEFPCLGIGVGCSDVQFHGASCMNSPARGGMAGSKAPSPAVWDALIEMKGYGVRGLVKEC